MSQDPSEVYARLLLPKRQGYPLWIPEPNRQLPSEYRDTGVRIGDVGVVTPEGAFDFLFNICLPADHPINANRVPEGFEQLILQPHDIFDIENIHNAPSHLASVEIRNTQLNLDGATSENPLLPVGFGGGFQFSSSSSEGAILMLPHGGSRQDLRNLTKFRQYAIRHGIRWYQYVNGPNLGREATNGSIYLVTGSDMVKSWGVASFSNASAEHGVSLIFTAAGVAEGNASVSLAWQTLSPASVRTGPKRIESDLLRNQCVFIRGFMVMIREGTWSKILGPVHTTTIVDSKAKTLLNKRGKSPFSESSRPSLFGHKPPPVADSSQSQPITRQNDDQDSSYDFVTPFVIAEYEPAPTEMCNPSRLINRFLLASSPTSEIAVSHDNDWCAILTNRDSTIPDAEELRRRFFLKFSTGLDGVGAYPFRDPFKERSKTQEPKIQRAKSGISGRTLILCFDGVTASAKQEHSNVSRFFSALKHDTEDQLVFYQAGSDTQAEQTMATRIASTIDTHGILGWDVATLVRDGFAYLVDNYMEGDRICIFGSSRGAYAARALACMVQKVGILHRGNDGILPLAFSLYQSESEADWNRAREFKQTVAHAASIDFIGVWDNLGSADPSLPLTTSNSKIRTFRHALALDERRAQFQPTLWTQPDRQVISSLQFDSLEDLGGFTDAEEVWFAGSHADVVGGDLPSENTSPAFIPLRWMIKECFMAQTGIQFNQELLRFGFQPSADIFERMRPSTERGVVVDRKQEELDAVAPLHDPYQESRLWWVHEIMPSQMRVARRDGSQTTGISLNLGRGRSIPRRSGPPKLHRTVKVRMEKGYAPKATYSGTPFWVE